MRSLVIKYLLCVPTIIVVSSMSFNVASAQVPGAIERQNNPSVLSDSGETNGEVIPFVPEVLSISDPCPEPKLALENTPSELKTIQEDITRFNLCLQRAQLLARLNDLALENIETINTSIDKKIEEKVLAFAPVPMPDISAPAFPDIAAGLDNAEITPEVLPTPQWYISEIKGKGNLLTAILSNEDTDIVNVSQGDIIPDTEIRVENISQVGVTILDGENSVKLKWKN